MFKMFKSITLLPLALLVMVAVALALTAPSSWAHDNTASSYADTAGGVETMAMGNGISGAIMASEAGSAARSSTSWTFPYGVNSSTRTGSQGSAGSGTFAFGNAAAGAGGVYDSGAAARARNNGIYGWY